MAWTFSMVCVAWVFFRAESVGEAVGYLSAFANEGPFIMRKKIVTLVLPFLLIEFLSLKVSFDCIPQVLRIAAYSFFLLHLLTVLDSKETFIYFQF